MVTVKGRVAWVMRNVCIRSGHRSQAHCDSKPELQFHISHIGNICKERFLGEGKKGLPSEAMRLSLEE